MRSSALPSRAHLGKFGQQDLQIRHQRGPERGILRFVHHTSIGAHHPGLRQNFRRTRGTQRQPARGGGTFHQLDRGKAGLHRLAVGMELRAAGRLRDPEA